MWSLAARKGGKDDGGNRMTHKKQKWSVCAHTYVCSLFAMFRLVGSEVKWCCLSHVALHQGL